MKTNNLFLLLLILPLWVYTQKESMEIVIDGNDAYFYHNNTERNCISYYNFELEQNGFDLILTELDILPECAYCECVFDLTTNITDLNSGNYSMDVFSIEVCMGEEDTLFWGNLDFTIEGNYNGLEAKLENPFSSFCLGDCVPPSSFKAIIDCNNLLGFQWSEESEKTILGYNLYLNGVFMAFLDDGISNFNYELESNTLYQFCLTTVCDDGESIPNCIDILLPDYLPPTDFHIDFAEWVPQLFWSPPDVDPEAIIGYTVYRDGYPISGSAPLEETNWSDGSVIQGETYEYYIKTIYEYCISPPSDSIEVYIYVGEDELEYTQLDIFPNPFNNQLEINSPERIEDIIIIDIIGNNVVQQKYFGKTKVSINTDNFKDGIYFIQIKTNNNLYVKKVIKRNI